MMLFHKEADYVVFERVMAETRECHSLRLLAWRVASSPPIRWMAACFSSSTAGAIGLGVIGVADPSDDTSFTGQ